MDDDSGDDDSGMAGLPGHPHARARPQVLADLGVSGHGLSTAEAAARLARYGPNALPEVKPPGVLRVFLRQFLSPLIYVLLVAAVLALFLREWSDAGFIFAVLLINAVIGTIQEHGAQRSADALRRLVTVRAQVERDGDLYEIDARQVVPGDLVLLDSGTKVPADLRLLDAHGLTLDESLLTGESATVTKDAAVRVAADSPLGDRVNMAFAGTLVTSGRARAVVVATGSDTELGRIASAVLGRELAKPPLLVRMETFTFRVTVAVAIGAILVAAVSLARGMPLTEIVLLAVALAVSAIPEGLPVALTVALAVGMERMARRNVIVRRLVAVEALGSCTCIASDKTGTLTVNQLTVRRLQLPDQPPWEVTGEGLEPAGTLILPQGASLTDHESALRRLSRAAVLANEAVLARHDGDWVGHGDTVDLALLVLARKAGLDQAEVIEAVERIATIPYEPASRYAASLDRGAGQPVASAKGAVETVLPMCSLMQTADGERRLQREEILQQAEAMAGAGYRVLALAAGTLELPPAATFSHEHLQGLTLLGLVGMADPLRPEAAEAVAACRRSGIRVAMVTGDHPATAMAIGRDLGLTTDAGGVVTGAQLAAAREQGETALDQLCARAQVFARVEPQQKLEIVQALQRNGHFVAVTGDGVNDAPALRAAQVGVAMGRGGTDVARETAELILTDDNFASIVGGVEEGRIAYANVRKVIFLLISTGAAELVLFALALVFALPLPLVAVQLLWLNLVTNGIQDVALAFEPGEGDELRRPPRPPGEPIFNRLMLERVILSAVVMGAIAFAAYHWMLSQGYPLAAARNGTLLLMVLFENVQAFNSRSELRSVFSHSPLRNRLLLFGVIVAQLIHIGAMYTPGLSGVLGLQPVSLAEWGVLLSLALTVLVVLEWHKARWREADARG